jgi:hypothetical protein
MDPERLHTSEIALRARGQLRSALRYVARTPNLRIPLAMMAVVGTLSFNFQVLLPLLASFTWHGTASLYTALAVAMGIEVCQISVNHPGSCFCCGDGNHEQGEDLAGDGRCHSVFAEGNQVNIDGIQHKFNRD